MEPEAGHGALLAYTADPVASPNVFTTILQLTGTITVPNLTRESTEITPHNETMGRFITSKVKKSGTISIEGNYLHDGTETNHDKISDFFLANTTLGLQFTGPSGTVGEANSVKMSGQFVNFKVEHPAGAGPRKMMAEFQPSGAMRIYGTLYQ